MRRAQVADFRCQDLGLTFVRDSVDYEYGLPSSVSYWGIRRSRRPSDMRMPRLIAVECAQEDQSHVGGQSCESERTIAGRSP